MASSSARELTSLSLGSPSGCSSIRDGCQCWICYEGGPGLIAPCQCTGSMRWVHRRCLDKWRVDATNPRNFTHCRHCGSAFQLELKRAPTEDAAQLRERRRRFLRGALSHFVLVAIGLQLGLCTLALLVRAVDRQEKLVTFFNFHQIEGSPPAGEGNFWNAVLHHKSTYYLAAVLLALFGTGVVGVLSLCLQGCCRRGGRRGSSRGRRDEERWSDRDALGDCCCETLGDCLCNCRHWPDCELSHCTSHGNCPCPEADGSGNCCDCNGDAGEGCASCAAVLAVAAVFIAVAFVVAGLFFVLMAAVTWLQKASWTWSWRAQREAATRYMQLSELRALTGEYVVKDLSEELYLDIEQRPAQQGMDAGRNLASKPEPGDLLGPEAPAMDSATQESLTMDLQAVYGSQSVVL